MTSLFREVFKARDKKNTKKFVAMKKVLMDNEKEGVSRNLQ
jgi:cyclin-dependent kinase 9